MWSGLSISQAEVKISYNVGQMKESKQKAITILGAYVGINCYHHS